MLGVAYGYSPSSMDDEFIKMAGEAMSLTIEGGGPASALVDFFPICEWIFHAFSTLDDH